MYEMELLFIQEQAMVKSKPNRLSRDLLSFEMMNKCRIIEHNTAS